MRKTIHKKKAINQDIILNLALLRLRYTRFNPPPTPNIAQQSPQSHHPYSSTSETIVRKIADGKLVFSTALNSSENLNP